MAISGKPVAYAKGKTYRVGQGVVVTAYGGSGKGVLVEVEVARVAKAPAAMFTGGGLPKGTDAAHIWEVHYLYRVKGAAALKNASSSIIVTATDASGGKVQNLFLAGAKTDCTPAASGSAAPGKTYPGCLYVATKGGKNLGSVVALVFAKEGQTALTWKS